MNPVSVTVVIACHTAEREPLIIRAVNSVTSQVISPERVIIVVDHNRALFDRLRDRLRSVTILENGFARGASGARNTGAFAAATDLVAFLDDDAAADPGWLSELIEAVRRPGVIGAGGFVRADWAAGRPSWFPGEFGWVVGATHDGSPTAATRVRNGWAENMIVRREAFVAVGGFRTGFGKVGAHSRPEDTDLCIRMQAAGGSWLFQPSAVVAHHVPVERSTFSFFLRRCYHEGRGKADLARLLPQPSAALSDEAAYVRRVLPAGLARHLATAIRTGRPAPLARAGAILVGLVATISGFAWQKLVDASGFAPAVPPGPPVADGDLAAAS